MIPIPAFLTNPLNYIKAAAIIGLIGVLGLAVWHYKSISDQAALVPGLEARVDKLQSQHARDDADAAKAALQIVANEAARQVSLDDFHKWDVLKTSLGNDLEGLLRHEPVTTDPACHPSAADRKLWNDTTRRLTADARP